VAKLAWMAAEVKASPLRKWEDLRLPGVEPHHRRGGVGRDAEGRQGRALLVDQTGHQEHLADVGLQTCQQQLALCLVELAAQAEQRPKAGTAELFHLRQV